MVHPDEIVPGVANYYATTIADGFDFASVLVKTREGRPVKIENNSSARVKGGSNARVQASVLSLYDKNRLQGPVINGESVTWDHFNAQVTSQLDHLATSGDEVILLTQSFASPSTSKLLKELQSKYSNIRHVIYDTISNSEALDAFQQKYGERGLPDYDFSKAEVIVAVGADFLGDWQGGGYDAGYAKSRIPKEGKMSRHIQFESLMSLSGANADKRISVTPAQQKEVIKSLAGKNADLPEHIQQAVVNAKKQLQEAGSKAIVVCGLPDIDAQTLALEINANLNSEIIDTEKPRLQSQGNSKEVLQVIQSVVAGKVKGLITVGVDPLYSFPDANNFAEKYANIAFTLAFTSRMDATATSAKFIAATPHYLESWGDVQIKKGYFALTQPTIRPLFNTKQFQDCVLAWLGEEKSYYDYIKDTITPLLLGKTWNEALHDGVFESSVTVLPEAKSIPSNNLESSSSSAAILIDANGISSFDLIFYSKTNMGDGQNANNPWLQEMPDPITRTSWDNYLTISASDASELGLVNKHVANGALNGSYVTITSVAGAITQVPVIIQPGQAKGTVGLAFGFGKTHSIQKEMQVGVNAFSIYHNFNGVQKVTLEKASGEHEFACVQLHNTMMGRDIIRETTLEVFNTVDAKKWNPMPMVSLNHENTPVDSSDVDLWESFDRSIGHHFNLSIDLNACTGCGACVIACHAENNVPVVGKSEIRRSRDMHWLRIDRYYSSEETILSDASKKNAISGLSESLSQFGELENPSENPQVAFQPVMCQHCNHAPCETVCPVAATSHSRQGQNHMAYNRCVGTRYCANNCPYKVRRFNWFLYSQNDEFDYHMNNDMGRMVLNPDVTVRSRGVMEKCSLCIQKTQKTILDAKRDGRAIKDGEFQTACSSACDKGAMIFGDINDEKSLITEKRNDKRKYHLIEYLGTKPNVMYQVKVRNTKEV